MIFPIANLLIKAFNINEQTATRAARWIVLILAALLIFGAIYGVLLFKNWRLQNEVERQKEARSQEHQERIDEAKENVNASANVVNKAIENVNAVANKSINTFSNNYSNTNSRYCERFPEDCR